ncbi:MAG: hypothetical protein H0T73_04245 [Ardenticatenales bacterium]|nr:hypothetical protein [Ardenticatenales bacterium]
MRLRFIVVFVFLLAMGLLGCSSPDGPVRIRIRNSSDQDFENYWLGAGGGGPSAVQYGAIGQGETTAYKSFPTTFAHYSKCNFITDAGEQLIVLTDIQTQLGVSELAPGAYTFDYDIVDGVGQLTVIQDE